MLSGRSYSGKSERGGREEMAEQSRKSSGDMAERTSPKKVFGLAKREGMVRN